MKIALEKRTIELHAMNEVIPALHLYKKPIVYYRGFLAKDATSYDLSLPQKMELNSLSAALWNLYEDGKVFLTQRRHGDDDYEYIATPRVRE
jgi:hypothetical protein